MLKLRHRTHTDDDVAAERDVDRERMDGHMDSDVITEDGRRHQLPVIGADDPTIVDRDAVRDDRTVVREAGPKVVTSPTELPPPPDQAGVRVEQIVTETTFSPGQMVIMLAGAVSLAFGIAAMVQGGLGGSLKQPVVQVFDFDHTPALGLIEAGAGIVLMLTGLHAALRPLAGLFGALMVAAGVVVLADIDWVREYLAAEQGFGWVPIAIGAAALLAAFALPATSRRRVTVVR